MSTNRFPTTMFRWEINTMLWLFLVVILGRDLTCFIFLVLQSVLCRLSNKKGWKGQKLIRVLLHRRGWFVGRPGNLLDKMQQPDSFSHHPFSHNDTVLRANKTGLGHDHRNRRSWFDLTCFCCLDGCSENFWYNSLPGQFGWDNNCKFLNNINLLWSQDFLKLFVFNFILGAMVDRACLLFSGSCRIYENFKLAIFILVFVSIAKATGLVLALFFPPNKSQARTTTTTCKSSGVSELFLQNQSRRR